MFKNIFSIEKIFSALLTAVIFAFVFLICKVTGCSHMDALFVLLFVLYVDYFADKFNKHEI